MKNSVTVAIFNKHCIPSQPVRVVKISLDSAIAVANFPLVFVVHISVTVVRKRVKLSTSCYNGIILRLS